MDKEKEVGLFFGKFCWCVQKEKVLLMTFFTGFLVAGSIVFVRNPFSPDFISPFLVVAGIISGILSNVLLRFFFTFYFSIEEAKEIGKEVGVEWPSYFLSLVMGLGAGIGMVLNPLVSPIAYFLTCVLYSLCGKILSVKKLLAALTVVVIFSFNASALDLKGTYDDILKNTTSPKVVQGQERGYVTLGSVYYRVPHSTLNLITIQPPKIRAGCSGIDLTFGSLSYLNLDQVVQWLKQILQAAPGVAFEVALKKFLPGIANVLNELSTMAQLVNQMGVDSCQASKAIVSHLFGFGAKMTEAEQQKSTNDNVNSGNADDFFASLNKALKNFNQSLKDWLSTSEGKAYKREIAEIRGDLLYRQFERKYGKDFDKTNSWAATQFRLISSLIGDVIISRKSSAGSDPDATQLYDVTYIPSVLNISDLLHISGSGIRYVYGIKTFKDALGEFRGVDENGKEDLYQIMKNLCSDAPAGYQSYCTNDPGFSGLVKAYMYSILNKIETHTPLSDKEKQFVGATPLPILKWLNTLAYFPGVGENFIEGSKDYIASYYVEALIRDGLYSVSGLPWKDMSEEQRDFIKSLYRMAGRRLKELQDIREKTRFPIKTFNQFADFVNHYEKAVVTSLANKGIFTSL